MWTVSISVREYFCEANILTIRRLIITAIFAVPHRRALALVPGQDWTFSWVARRRVVQPLHHFADERCGGCATASSLAPAPFGWAPARGVCGVCDLACPRTIGGCRPGRRRVSGPRAGATAPAGSSTRSADSAALAETTNSGFSGTFARSHASSTSTPRDTAPSAPRG